MEPSRPNVFLRHRLNTHDAQDKDYSERQDLEHHSKGYSQKLGAALLLFGKEFLVMEGNYVFALFSEGGDLRSSGHAASLEP